MKKKIFLILSVIGPGIITANVDNDAGGITTYSLAGAQFGYSLLWTLIPVTVALIIVQEMAARMGAVTGKGLADLIRENYGIKITFYLMILLLLTDLGNTVAEFAGWAAAMEIFGVNRYFSVPVGAFLIWWLVVKGTYRTVEKIFLIACTIYFTYIISGWMAHPPWKTILVQTIVPTISLQSDYLVMMVGVIGTTIAPWMQFYLQSAIVEKGIDLQQYKLSRLDVIVGCIFTDVVAFFIIVACAATLYQNHIHVEDARDAALSLAPFAGRFASYLFAAGLANASLFAASILPLATAYYICEGLGWEAGINKTFKEAPQFMWLYTGLIVVGALVILFPQAPLLKIMLLSQVANGIILPVVLVFMILLVNNAFLMGEHTNSTFLNIMAWTTIVVLILLTIVMTVSLVFPDFIKLIGF